MPQLAPARTFCVLEFYALGFAFLGVVRDCEILVRRAWGRNLRGAACDLKRFIFQAGVVKFTVKHSCGYKMSYLAPIDCLRNGLLLLAPCVIATVLNAAFVFVLRARWISGERSRDEILNFNAAFLIRSGAVSFAALLHRRRHESERELLRRKARPKKASKKS